LDHSLIALALELMASSTGISAAAQLRALGLSHFEQRLADESITDADLLFKLSYAQLRECKLTVGEAQLLWERLKEARLDAEKPCPDGEVVEQAAPDTSEKLAAGLDSLTLPGIILSSMAANYLATYLGELSDLLRDDWRIQLPFLMMFIVEMTTIYSTFICSMHGYYSRRRLGERGLKLHRRLARIATLMSIVVFVYGSSLHSAPFVESWITALQLVLATLVVLGVSIAWSSFHRTEVVKPRKESKIAEALELRASPLRSSTSASAPGSRHHSIEGGASIGACL